MSRPAAPRIAFLLVLLMVSFHFRSSPSATSSVSTRHPIKLTFTYMSLAVDQMEVLKSSTSTAPSVTSTTTTTTTTPHLTILTAAERWASTQAAVCIRFHESTDGANPLAYNNLYQFEGQTWNSPVSLGGLGMPGAPGQFSRSVQNTEAYRLYLERGYQPWQADDYYCAKYE